jgi:hypothetical protein
MKKEGAISASFGRLKSEDGVIVERTFAIYPSAARAQQEFDNLVKGAPKVVERGTKVSPEGERIGERAVLEMPGSRPGEVKAVVVWSSGPRIVVLESVSFHHVLALDSQDYPAPLPRPTP